MLSDNDRAYLFRSLEMNQCLLFVGAGFSADATNALGGSIPLAEALAQALWKWQGLTGSYDGSPLGEVYESALRCGKPLRTLKEFLELQLLATKVPAWYQQVHRVYWQRIYGTNVDNVVEMAHRGASPEMDLDVIAAPKGSYRDRDQFLRRVQYVKLNGSLPGSPEDLTFATRQYARRSAEYDEWYDHFVRDYALHPTIFVGTELREPLFWQAIESRQRRGTNPEERPRSFLVAPELSPAKAPILESLNIVHVPVSGRGFFEWLNGQFSFPKRVEVLTRVVPEIADLFSDRDMQVEYQEAIEGLLAAFPRVPLMRALRDQPKTFFLGATPTWADITSDLDAPREITVAILKRIEEALEGDPKLCVLGLLGAGGSGKSTILRRLALTLRQQGKQVFFSEGGDRPTSEQVSRGLQELPDRAVLMIDNAGLLGGAFRDVIRGAESVRRPPVIVFASRFNLFERRLRGLVPERATRVFDIPDLSDQDINNLINTLDKHRQLGKLEGLSSSRRVKEFKIRARKQILVAMREATQGRGFDDIIRGEFREVDSQEARILFLCAALATAEFLDLSTGQWLACSNVSPSDALSLLRRNLKGLLLEYGEPPRVAARHPIIAEHIVKTVAQRPELAEAYKRTLAALSHDIYGGPGRRGRSWRLFVRLISHAQVYERFTQDIEIARGIYESIAQWFRSDGHFWLQYTNLEIQYGDLELARAHLANAESLMPDQDQVLTTTAHLCFREALTAATRQEAVTLRSHAEEILIEQISRLGEDDEYPYHVYLTQELAWIEHWETDVVSKKAALGQLDSIAGRALEFHAGSPRIRGIAEQVRRQYLSTALPGNKGR